MADYSLLARFKQASDSFETWSKNNPVLLKGELAIIEVLPSSEAPDAEPVYLMKVGDGVKHFNNLPFMSANASDVYAWAKAATKPEYELSEIKQTSGYVVFDCGTATKNMP